jgi:hypothetical protein
MCSKASLSHARFCRMLNLAFDRKNRILRVTVSGIFASEDLDALDHAVLEFVGREGQVRSIYDFTAIEAFAVPHSRMILRAQQPAIVSEQRVLVAPPVVGVEASQAFSRHQREVGERGLVIVADLEEAYAVLRLRNPQFEPVER